MFENWWTIQQMVEAREREIGAQVRRLQPWARPREARERGRVRKALGSLLVSWGTTLARQS